MNNNGTMKNLKKIVKAKGISLTSLAVELEISQEAISQYISGKIKPKTAIVIKMAKILNTTTDYLLDLTDNPKPNNFNISENELALLSNYNLLSFEEQSLVNGYIKGILDVKNIKWFYLYRIVIQYKNISEIC